MRTRVARLLPIPIALALAAWAGAASGHETGTARSSSDGSTTISRLSAESLLAVVRPAVVPQAKASRQPLAPQAVRLERASAPRGWTALGMSPVAAQLSPIGLHLAGRAPPSPPER